MNLTAPLRSASIDDLQAEILELPYANDDILMAIVMPKEGYTIRLRLFMQKNGIYGLSFVT
jgi:serine protease inhibitor